MRIRQLAAALLLAASYADAWVSAQGAGAPGQNGPQATGLILGRVVEADSGAPVASVLVTLGSGLPTTALLAGGTDQRRVLTDTQGRFVFRSLTKGSYTLTATVGGNGFSVSGFIASGLGQPIAAYLPGAYGQRRPNGPAETIDLGEGQHVGDAVIRMWKGGAIVGTIFDEAGEPLVAVVVAAAKRSSDGKLLTGPTARTDDRGAYHLGTLEPGDYLVVVPQTQILMPLEMIDALLASPVDGAGLSKLTSAGVPQNPTAPGVKVGASVVMAAPQGGVVNALPPARVAEKSYAYQTTFYPSAAVASRATPIRVQSGEDRTGIDIHLQPVPAVQVSGTLTDGAGPVPSFGVHLMPADADDGGSVLEVATAVTNGRGEFVFPLVPAGRYTLIALRYAPLSVVRPATPSTAIPRMSEQIGVSASQAISVGDQNVAGLALALRPGVLVSGRVEFQGSSALPSDRIIRRVGLVRAQPIFRTSTPQPGNAFPLAGGEFSIAGVPPGRYVLRVPDEAYADWSLQSMIVAGREVADGAVLIGDTDVLNVAVVLTDKPAELGGSVVATTGAPDADASVFVFPADLTRWVDARVSTRSFRTVRVSKAGTFRLTRMIPGDYLAVAIPDARAGDWPDERLLAVLAQHASSLRIDAGQKATISLKTVDIR